MRKKICPVCDRELTAAGYCRLCRRLVFKPVVRDVDYYLNENRPDNQTLLNQKRILPEGHEAGGKPAEGNQDRRGKNGKRQEKE